MLVVFSLFYRTSNVKCKSNTSRKPRKRNFAQLTMFLTGFLLKNGSKLEHNSYPQHDQISRDEEHVI